MAARDGLGTLAQARGLEPVDGELRELTPALITGSRGEVSSRLRGELAPGLRGELIHHRFAEGATSRESTIVLSSIPESVAFVPALVCRDRAAMGRGAPAQLPAERWTETTLESSRFNSRYRLLTLGGQDAGWVRELFSPALIAWLADRAPAGLSFELNDGNFVVALPGHLNTPEQVQELCDAAAELAQRIRTEAEEEELDPDLFDETEKVAAIERAMTLVRFDEPPPTVQAAVQAYKRRARRNPGVILNAAFWTLIVAAVMVGAGMLVAGTLGAIAAAVVALFVVCAVFPLALLVGAARHQWGTASVSRIGLEAWVRGYADSRDLTLRNRRRFHSDFRALPLPGIADHVLEGEIPEAGIRGLFVMLGDASELRSRGTEMAFTATRPLASNALVAELEQPPAATAVKALELPEEWAIEVAGRQVIVWRPVAGNLIRTSEGSDRFRARAGALLGQVVARPA